MQHHTTGDKMECGESLIDCGNNIQRSNINLATAYKAMNCNNLQGNELQQPTRQ